jgi:hypothetical protein
MKSIRTWLEEDAEVTLSISSLTSYISRIRRRAKRPALPPQAGRNEVARAKRPKTIRLLKPNAFCRNPNSTSASSITTVIPKAEI